MPIGHLSRPSGTCRAIRAPLAPPGIDCFEAPTGNIWTNNLGDESTPDGICSAS